MSALFDSASASIVLLRPLDPSVAACSQHNWPHGWRRAWQLLYDFLEYYFRQWGRGWVFDPGHDSRVSHRTFEKTCENREKAEKIRKFASFSTSVMGEWLPGGALFAGGRTRQRSATYASGGKPRREFGQVYSPFWGLPGFAGRGVLTTRARES